MLRSSAESVVANRVEVPLALGGWLYVTVTDGNTSSLGSFKCSLDWQNGRILHRVIPRPSELRAKNAQRNHSDLE